MQADRLSAVDPTRARISQQVLFDLGGQRWAWYLRVHHLAADGYGMALFSDRVCALYSGRAGEPLPGLAGVLADDAAYRADARRGLAGQWWREQLQGAPAGVGLAAARCRVPRAAAAGFGALAATLAGCAGRAVGRVPAADERGRRSGGGRALHGAARQRIGARAGDGDERAAAACRGGRGQCRGV
ncbi:hypothetical protein G6F68_014601 [Rhizopus microsporus]|nr:hypothetical protein G6F68_014601 [Rhizopus microsporus]